MAAEQASSPGRGRSRDGEAPYAGLLGRTRSETVHVLLPDGHVRAVSVYVGIDAVADPALAQLARAGTLHHVAQGVELAIPFVYHDALARVFVLVVPEPLRHRALALRAEHMMALAADTAHATPAYVRDLEIVVGADGLIRRLEQGEAEGVNGIDRGASDALRAIREREQELARRERLLDARERALRLERTTLLAVRDSDIEELADAEAVDDAFEAIVDDDDDDEVTAYAPHAVSGEYAEIVELNDGEASLEDDDDAIELLDDRDDGISILPGIPGPPLALLDDPGEELALFEADGRAWLFVRSRGELLAPELALQLDPALEPPVVLVTLRDGEEVRRTALDPFVPEQMGALHQLAHHFEVELVLFDGEAVEHLARVESRRETNVRAILAHLERQGPFSREAWERARDIARDTIPARDPEHPFQGREVTAPLTATEAAVVLDELAEWLAPERLARVRMLLAVPDEIVDATYRAGISYGLDWGLSLTRELAAKALELGIEKDEGALLARRIEGLCRTSRAHDLGGLEEGVLRAEWSEALEQAARLGVALGDEARELATQHAGERAVVHAAALSDARDASLDPLRERAFGDPADMQALEELLARGGYRDVLEACRVAHKLAPAEAARLFAHAARRDDPAALDALLSLLSFSEPLIVRAGAALALSARRALNALDELVSHVAREGDPDYELFALALGRYGAGSFRAIARALKVENVEPERSALVIAHLALHGARAQVRTKARARERKDAQLAERALALASELKDGKKPALALEQQGPLTVFCEVFDRLSRDPEG